MAFKAYNSRIRAENKIDDGTPPGGGEVVTLKTDSLEVQAEPYLANGSTAQQNYDGQTYFQDPSFRMRATLSFNFEMTKEDGYQSQSVDALHDLLNIWFVNDASNREVHLYVNYDEVADSFSNYPTGSGAINDFVIPDVVPDITTDTAGWVFEERARTKERELELITSARDYSYSEVRWIFE